MGWTLRVACLLALASIGCAGVQTVPDEPDPWIPGQYLIEARVKVTQDTEHEYREATEVIRGELNVGENDGRLSMIGESGVCELGEPRMGARVRDGERVFDCGVDTFVLYPHQGQIRGSATRRVTNLIRISVGCARFVRGENGRQVCAEQAWMVTPQRANETADVAVRRAESHARS